MTMSSSTSTPIWIQLRLLPLWPMQSREAILSLCSNLHLLHTINRMVLLLRTLMLLLCQLAMQRIHQTYRASSPLWTRIAYLNY
jgi:hypothetical protein